jgi:transcriptional regulator
MFDEVDRVPQMLRSRLLSLRAFDAQGMLLDADVVEGGDVETLIARLFANARVAYIHVHFARPGCYAALVERA